MRQIIVLTLAALVIVAAPRPAAASCFYKAVCSSNYPCYGTLTSISTTCLEEAEDRGLVLGMSTNTRIGDWCGISDLGAAGCVDAIAFERYPPVNNCKLVSRSYLSGVGCCGHVCPPTMPDCEQN